VEDYKAIKARKGRGGDLGRKTREEGFKNQEGSLLFHCIARAALALSLQAPGVRASPFIMALTDGEWQVICRHLHFSPLHFKPKKWRLLRARYDSEEGRRILISVERERLQAEAEKAERKRLLEEADLEETRMLLKEAKRERLAEKETPETKKLLEEAKGKLLEKKAARKHLEEDFETPEKVGVQVLRIAR